MMMMTTRCLSRFTLLSPLITQKSPIFGHQIATKAKITTTTCVTICRFHQLNLTRLPKLTRDFQQNTWLRLISSSWRRNFTSNQNDDKKSPIPNPITTDEEWKQLGLFARYKKMMTKYWYVLIPVHAVTSCMWFGLFYLVVKSGMDVKPIFGYLKHLPIPEEICEMFETSGLGDVAVVLLLYKLATPARYVVTLTGTTAAIRQLTARGLLKPMPSTSKLKSIINDRIQSREQMKKRLRELQKQQRDQKYKR